MLNDKTYTMLHPTTLQVMLGHLKITQPSTSFKITSEKGGKRRKRQQLFTSHNHKFDCVHMSTALLNTNVLTKNKKQKIQMCKLPLRKKKIYNI